MRNGNFLYEVKLPGAFIVHRGVSQGGRKLTPEKRAKFWQKHYKKISGIEFDPAGNGLIMSVSVSALRELRKRNLVVACNQEKPRVWTPNRIIKSGRKVQTMPQPKATTVVRRGGLKL